MAVLTALGICNVQSVQLNNEFLDTLHLVMKLQIIHDVHSAGLALKLEVQSIVNGKDGQKKMD